MYWKEQGIRLNSFGLIAEVVSGNKATYDEVFLGKKNEEYCKWILNPDSWGGAIELSILTNHYQTEIAVVDSQTLRMDIYGQSLGYKQRVFLIYDGIHYDALALTLADGLPEEMDVSIFSPDDSFAVAKGQEVAEDANRRGLYTDMAHFTLRCLVCQQGLKGQKEAVEHAKLKGTVGVILVDCRPLKHLLNSFYQSNCLLNYLNTWLAFLFT